MAPSVPLASALQQRLQLRAVESDHGLSVDHRDRRGEEPLVLQLGEGLLVGADVLLGESHAALVKELLHLAAEQSARLRIDYDRLRHRSPPPCASTACASRIFPLRGYLVRCRAA